MKKLVCFFAMIGLVFSLHSFDSSLLGGWGLVMPGNERLEIIRFNPNGELIITGERFLSGNYEASEDTIYIDDFDGDAVIIQYYSLAQNKLLFIMWSLDNPEMSLTLILSRFN
jgi:hypothetical protein